VTTDHPENRGESGLPPNPPARVASVWAPVPDPGSATRHCLLDDPLLRPRRLGKDRDQGRGRRGTVDARRSRHSNLSAALRAPQRQGNDVVTKGGQSQLWDDRDPSFGGDHPLDDTNVIAAEGRSPLF
jgi:hypothetical protein